jgi:hypothetical protein
MSAPSQLDQEIAELEQKAADPETEPLEARVFSIQAYFLRNGYRLQPQGWDIEVYFMIELASGEWISSISKGTLMYARTDKSFLLDDLKKEAGK